MYIYIQATLVSVATIYLPVSWHTARQIPNSQLRL